MPNFRVEFVQYVSASARAAIARRAELPPKGKRPAPHLTPLRVQSFATRSAADTYADFLRAGADPAEVAVLVLEIPTKAPKPQQDQLFDLPTVLPPPDRKIDRSAWKSKARGRKP